MARTRKAVQNDYEKVLEKAGIECVALDKELKGSGVRLATMHRVKGLEFPVVILAGLNANAMPLRLPSAQKDAVTKMEHASRERALLFVAATRARDLVSVSSYGTPSVFVSALAVSGEADEQ